MAIEYYYRDGGDTENTIYVAGTTTTQAVLRGTEFGADDGAIRLIGEKTPSRFADQHRGVVYDPRDYGYGLILLGTSKSNLQALKAAWSTYHDRELGEGFVKRVTASGNTRCLDCFLRQTDWAEPEGYSQELTAHYLARNPFWRDESLTTNESSLTVPNHGFETFTGTEDDGTSDDFDDWTEVTDDGNGDKVEATATKWGGSYAVKLTRGTGTPPRIDSAAAISVTAGDTLRLVFRARGDGTYAGAYHILDDTNSETIESAATGVTGTSYTEVSHNFTVPAGCSGIKLRFWANATNTSVVYYDSITLTNTAVPNVDCIVYNGSFESGTLTDDNGVSDDFDNWTEVNDDGNGDKTESTATVHGGSHALKLTRGTGTRAYVHSAAIIAVAGETVKLSVWTRGDGTYDGAYAIWDLSNSAWIKGITATAITAASYTEFTYSFAVPSNCSSIQYMFYANNTNTAVAYFDDVTLTRTTVVISLTNSGDIPAWIHATITGVVNTPVLTLGSDSQTINKTTSNADDELRSDAKPNGTTRRSVRYFENGAGDGVGVATTSGSKFLKLATGANSLKVSATSGTPTVKIQYYNYYRGLF